MPDFSLKELRTMIEELFGPKLGRFMIRSTILAGLLIAISVALYWFLRVIGMIWRGMTSAFGITSEGLSLGNIEFIIGVLVAMVAFFVIIFALAVYTVARAFRRRLVPQSAIDTVAQLRSDGISVYNKPPASAAQQDVTDWKTKEWQPWADRVVVALDKSFTKAERMFFTRLGLLPTHTFTHAVSQAHNHMLQQLAVQLVRLEELITRHQDRH